MSTEITSLSVLWEWVQIGVVFILGLFGWHMRTQSQRLADLEKQKADKNEINGAFKELRTTIQNGFDKTHMDINSMHARIDRIKDK